MFCLDRLFFSFSINAFFALKWISLDTLNRLFVFYLKCFFNETKKTKTRKFWTETHANLEIILWMCKIRLVYNSAARVNWPDLLDIRIKNEMLLRFFFNYFLFVFVISFN